MPLQKIGLVLSAGGARAAYQVGVLYYIGKTFKNFNPKIFTGVSSGSINASFLAQGEPFHEATKRLYQLWEQLEFDQVVKVNFQSIFRIGTSWIYDLFLSKVTRKLTFKSIFDASPLSYTLVSHIHFWKIAKAIRTGTVEGLAVSATNYQDGNTTIFFDSTDPILTWKREKRISIRSTIRIRHIIASCSIPILFEPVRIGEHFFGDGALRFSYPISPAIHLGANRILAIGIRSPTPASSPPCQMENLSLGYVAGSVLNSIFLDSLEADYENLTRMNRLTNDHTRKIEAFLLRPSQDLGELASHFINEIPFHIRQLFRATAMNPNELGDLMSYLMFSRGYLNALLKLGFADAEHSHSELEKFLENTV